MPSLHPTPYPALNGLLRELANGARTILGDNFTGAYLQGSLAIGDFDEHSDIDFLIVIEEELTDAQLSALQSLHRRLYGLGGRYPPDCPTPTRILAPDHWETSLEGTYFPRQLLKRPGPARVRPWYLDNGSTTLERSDHDDTLVVRWTLRERGITLAGPAPRSLIDPIPDDAMRQEVRATMHLIETLLADSFWNSRFGQPFAVLTFCRMLQTLATGTITSKRAGAVWGREKLDRQWHGLIERAWNARGHGHVSEPADPNEFARTREFIRYAIAESDRLLSALIPPLQ